MHIEKKKRFRRIIWSVAAASLLAFILWNSTLSFDGSNNLSFWVLDRAVEIFPGLRSIYWMTLHAVLRKIAHFVEYAALGGLGMLLFFTFGRRLGSRRLWLPAAVVLLVACTDEFLQRFSPDRTSSVKDIALDMAGALCGMAVCLAMRALVRKLSDKKNCGEDKP